MKTTSAKFTAVATLVFLCAAALANQAPTVSITSPVNEYEDLIAPANMTITASAGDSDGTISKVEFYQNGALLGQSTQSPYSFSWTGIAAGRYALTAVATDNGGLATTSATVYVTINGATVNGFLDRRWYSSSNATGYIPYRLFMPPNYNASVKYPVVIFLHGIGEAGTNNTNQINNNCNGAGVFVSAANQTAYPCIMICPQSSSGWWGTEPNSIMKKIQAKYNGDIDRLYITGLSAGGISTWQELIAENTLYAAAVPICGNGDTSKANLLTNIPIWDFHCADDPTVSVAGSDQMIGAIRANGGNPIFTRYAQGGHGSWVPAYGNSLLVPWVMAQRRGVAPTNSPLLSINAPTSAQTYSTTNGSISLSGTTIDASTQVTSVTWSNNAGGSGTATGTANWSTTGIPLFVGNNLIQVIATGTSYNASYGGVTTFNDTINVNLGGTQTETPFNGTPFAIPGMIPASQFDNGGEGLAYHDIDAGNSGGQFRATGVDIENCSEGGYDVGWTAAGEWMNYMVNVGAAGSYDIEARVAAPGTASFHINFGSTNIGTFNVPNTGGYQSWQSVTLSGINLSAGQQIMQIYEDTSGFNIEYIKITARATPNTPPTISTVPAQTIAMNANTGALAFTVGDAETAAASLTVSGSSNNTTLVPNANIVFGGSGANRTVTVTPAANQSGTATITLSVSDGAASASSTFTLTVTAPQQETPFNASPFAIPGMIPSAQFDNGGEGVAYHDADAGNSGGQYRTTDVDIEFCGEGGYDIGWTNAGEWLNYMVNVTSAGSYDIQARVASPVGGAAFHLNFGATNVGSIAVPNTGGWQTYQTVTLSGVNLSAGQQVMKLSIDTGNFNITYIQVVAHVAANTPPTISTVADQKILMNLNTGALAFTVGDSQTAAGSLTVSGSSNNTTLVPNANIVFGGSGANRTVTVTPAAGQKGSATITLTVSDGSLTASSNFMLTVTDIAAAIDCGGTANFTAADGTVYSADGFYNGGAVNNFVRPINNTVDDALYQNYRWLSPVLDYSIPVPNGTYAVTLKFADIYSTAAGQKIFDVTVNGGLVAKALDVYALVGADTAYDITCAATVTNGVLDLQFLNPAAGNPSINAILVKARANRAPTASAVQISTTTGTAKAVALAGADLDGDYLLYTIVTPPAHGTLAGSGANLTYTPAAGYTGADSFTYKVSDGAATSATATVSITVTAPNSPPSIVSGATASPNPSSPGTAVAFSVAASDPNGDALSYSWNFGDGSSGTGANASHAYTSAGTYTATVNVSDGKGGTASSSVTVSVVSTVAINSGGAAVGSFAADQNVSGGSTYTTTSAINTTGVTNPAPQAVYQSERYGNFTYTVGGLTSGAAYTVRLHFAEIWWNGAGQRVFNVSINGTQVLSNFDIFAAAGGKFIAIAQSFNATANSGGQIVITYTTIVDNAKSSGIEVISGGAAGRSIEAAVIREVNTDDEAISSIDLGTVQVGKKFKFTLEAPEAGALKKKLRWFSMDRTKLAPGVAARSGCVFGKAKKPGTYTFDLQIKGTKTNATNTYTLTVLP